MPDVERYQFPEVPNLFQTLAKTRAPASMAKTE